MAEPVAKKSLMDRFLNTVEAAGNKLPDPATLFILLAVLVLVLSAVFGAMGASAVHPGTHKVIKVVNLLTVDGFRMIPPGESNRVKPNMEVWVTAAWDPAHFVDCQKVIGITVNAK